MKHPRILMILILAAAAFAVQAVRADVPSEVLEAENRRIEAMDKAKDAVLAIFKPGGGGGGSGVVVTPDGYAVTNFHVVRPCGNSMKCGMADGKVYDAVIVGIDPTGDVAVIKLFGRDDFPAAEIADSNEVEPGDWCFAMGNPFLLADDFQPTATFGVVSGTHRYQFPSGTILEYTDCIQTDASINPGNSGGPLFDAQGRLIGINGRGSFEKRGRVNVGLGYAISINQVMNFMGYLRSGRIVDHATLGATVAFDEDGQVVVTDIIEDCDAYRRGLRFDDEIVSFAGRRITTPNTFKNVLGILPKGWRVPLSYRREGKREDILVRLEGVHRSSELIDKLSPKKPNLPIPVPKPDDKPDKDAPKDGEKPDKDAPKDGEKPKEGKKPIPIKVPAGMMAPKPPPLPEIVKKHFEANRGFSNYYYNKLNRQRVWDAWEKTDPSVGADGDWILEGQLDGGGAFSFLLTDEKVTLKLPTIESEWNAADGIVDSLLPPQSGGLLPALHLWRRLAALGPDKFGDVYYLGTAPLVGHDGLVDVLVGSHAGVECRFMFDPKTGRMLAIEMFADEEADPCEIYFSDFVARDGRSRPGRVEARFGDDVFAIFKLEECDFKSAE